MGIHTKEFGEITWVSGELNQKHYYEYLNELAVAERGLLVSRNFQTILGYEVGDSVTVQVDAKDNSSAITGKIVDFFDYWPGYAKTETELNPDGTTSTNENYLVVTHYNLLYEKWGLKPYEVWISLKDGYDSRYVYDWIQEKDGIEDSPELFFNVLRSISIARMTGKRRWKTRCSRAPTAS